MPTTDIYAAFAPSPSAPARRIQAVTPADGTDLPIPAKALYVGGAGDLSGRPPPVSPTTWWT